MGTSASFHTCTPDWLGLQCVPLHALHLCSCNKVFSTLSEGKVIVFVLVLFSLRWQSTYLTFWAEDASIEGNVQNSMGSWGTNITKKPVKLPFNKYSEHHLSLCWYGVVVVFERVNKVLSVIAYSCSHSNRLISSFSELLLFLHRLLRYKLHSGPIGLNCKHHLTRMNVKQL